MFLLETTEQEHIEHMPTTHTVCLKTGECARQSNVVTVATYLSTKCLFDTVHILVHICTALGLKIWTLMHLYYSIHLLYSWKFLAWVLFSRIFVDGLGQRV